MVEIIQKEKWLEEWEKTLETISDNEMDGYIALRIAVDFYNSHQEDEKIIQHANLDYKILLYTINFFEKSIRFYLSDGLVLSFYILQGSFKSTQKLCYSIYSLSGGE